MSFEGIYLLSNPERKQTIAISEPYQPGVLPVYIEGEACSLLIVPLPKDEGLEVRCTLGHAITEAPSEEEAKAIWARLLPRSLVIAEVPRGYSYLAPKSFSAVPDASIRVSLRHIIDTPGVLPDNIN